MAGLPTRIIANNPDNTGALRNGHSLSEAVGAWASLQRLDDRLAVGDCPLLGCEDPVGSFTVFQNHRSEETFGCSTCQRAGDLCDFEVLMSRKEPAELLEGLAAYIRRYVVLSDEQALLLALWIVHTHALDAADTTPYINIKSAEKRSGKTRLLEVLSLLVARPWLTGRVTAAVLVRKTSAEQPALLLDESDAAFRADREYAEALRGILNTGFRRGSVASLCVGQGANLTYKDFPVFCPKAIAGIGKLPDTVADRSIPIELRRRRATEKVERFRLRKAAATALPLQRGAAAWAAAHLADLKGREPDLPVELDDRAQDIIEPLLAIADTVGGEWPEKARRAARTLLTGEEREESESLGVRLLHDLRNIFEKEKAERLSTGTILEKLHEADEAPWGSLRGEPLDARGLARLLKPYGIRPKQIREGEQTHKGYKQEDFEDAWSRYLDEAHADSFHTPSAKRNSETDHSNPAYRGEISVSGSVPDAKRVSDVEHEKPHRNGDVSDVSDNAREDEEMQRTGIIQSERQVFELAREHFGLNEKDGAA
jgi:hypothetical protein